MKFLKLDQPL